LSTRVDQSPRINVELDIFSGRSNPSWELREVQAETLLHMLDEARQAGRARGSCSAPDLGYRGLYLNIQAASKYTTWHVFEDCLENDGQFFDDSTRKIETYVLRSMPPQLSKDLANILPQINH
jgi:hypothetical protein